MGPQGTVFNASTHKRVPDASLTCTFLGAAPPVSIMYEEQSILCGRECGLALALVLRSSVSFWREVSLPAAFRVLGHASTSGWERLLGKAELFSEPSQACLFLWLILICILILDIP